MLNLSPEAHLLPRHHPIRDVTVIGWLELLGTLVAVRDVAESADEVGRRPLFGLGREGFLAAVAELLA